MLCVCFECGVLLLLVVGVHLSMIIAVCVCNVIDKKGVREREGRGR